MDRDLLSSKSEAPQRTPVYKSHTFLQPAKGRRGALSDLKPPPPRNTTYFNTRDKRPPSYLLAKGDASVIVRDDLTGYCFIYPTWQA